MKNTSRKHGIITTYKRSTTLWKINWSTWSTCKPMVHRPIDLYPTIRITTVITNRINYLMTQNSNMNSLSLSYKHDFKLHNVTLRKLRMSTKIWSKILEPLRNFTSNSSNKPIKLSRNWQISDRKIKDLKLNLLIRRRYPRPKPSNWKKKMSL